MFYIYILYAPIADKYYIGYTSNPAQRLIQHNSQVHFNTFTAKYRPWLMAAHFKCSTLEGEAIKIERFIKKQKSRKQMELLIAPAFIPTGQLAQLVRVPEFRD